MFGSKSSQVIFVDKGESLNDEQIRDAFNVGESVPWWRALLQIIQVRAAVCGDNAKAACESNNGLAVAAAIGGEDALLELLVDLQSRRQQATK